MKERARGGQSKATVYAFVSLCLAKKGRVTRRTIPQAINCGAGPGERWFASGMSIARLATTSHDWVCHVVYWCRCFCCVRDWRLRDKCVCVSV